MVLDRVIKPTVVFVEFAEVHKVERSMTSIIFVMSYSEGWSEVKDSYQEQQSYTWNGLMPCLNAHVVSAAMGLPINTKQKTEVVRDHGNCCLHC